MGGKISFILILTLCLISARAWAGPEFTPQRQKDTARLMQLIHAAIPIVHHNPDSSLLLLQQALQLSELTDMDEGKCLCYAFMGLILNNKGQTKEGFSVYRKALPYCQATKSSSHALSDLYINMGTSYMGNGDLDSANIYYYKALGYLQEHQPGSNNIGIIYCNLAAVNSNQGNYEKALRLAARAEQIGSSRNLPLVRVPALINMGNMYAVLGKPDSALYCFEKGLKVARSNGYVDREQALLCSMGDMKLESGDPYKAIYYYKQARDLNNESNIYFGSIMPGYRLGIAYFRTKQYPAAERALLSAMALAETTHLNLNKHLAHQTLADLYEATGRYKESLNQRKIGELLKDSMYNVEKTKAINEIENKYNAVQKDKTITQNRLYMAQQQRYIERMSLLTAAGILVVLLVSSIIFIVQRNKRKNEKKEKELEQLRAQMMGVESERKRISRELHDGVGGLLTSARLNIQSIQGENTTQQQELHNLSELLVQVSNEVQHTAHNLMPDILEERNLWFALSAYCDQVERSRNIPIELNTMGDAYLLDSSVSLPLYRITQELVQNAVKHSGCTQIFVQVRIDYETQRIMLSVEDNGKGFDTSLNYDGLGIKSVKERVKVLEGFISIASSEGMGATIFVDIDLKNKSGLVA